MNISNGIITDNDICGIPLNVDIIDPSGAPNVRTFQPLQSPPCLVIHNTGNPSPTAGDENHAIYLQNVENNADQTYLSWHFTVDADSITQHLPLTEHGWHAGDGTNGYGNLHGIGIEIAENANYLQAEANGIVLIKALMVALVIPIDWVRPHRYFAPDKKLCPHLILISESQWKENWAKFQQRITGTAMVSDSTTPAAAPQQSAAPVVVGQYVTVNGSGYSTAAATGARTKTFKGTTMKVLAYRAGSAAPYQLTQILDSDDTTGFFTADQVSGVTATPVAATTEQTSKYVVIAGVSCNVYGALPATKAINWYMRGREVDVVSIENGMAKIKYEEGYAYITARWLKKV